MNIRMNLKPSRGLEFSLCYYFESTRIPGSFKIHQSIQIYKRNILYLEFYNNDRYH